MHSYPPDPFNEAKYRTLVEHIPQKVFIKDINSRYLSISDNLARDFGIRPEEVVGKGDYDFCPKILADKRDGVRSCHAISGKHQAGWISKLNQL
jgi:PAS domain S-box-containing protein